MQKFLIIVKFASIHHFCQFYQQLVTGMVFLPTVRPLPEKTQALLHLRIPELTASFLVPGHVAPPDPAKGPGGLAVDVVSGLERVLPALTEALTEKDVYRAALALNSSPGMQESLDTAGEYVTEIEIETGDEPEALSFTDPPSATPSEFSLDADLEDDLLHLEMENADDGLSSTFDFDVRSQAGHDDGMELRLQSDDEDSGFQKPAFRIQDVDAGPSAPPAHQSDFVFDDLRQMADQLAFEREIVQPAVFSTRKIPEKKDLTTEERALAEPVGKFFMNFTKAILRSGYYDPDHPSSKSAKQGLYNEFISVLGGCREIMITHQTSRDGSDIMLTGILDEPVSVRLLVGVGTAELFVPKLTAYCDKKRLLTFAVKQDITPDHFYAFIDVMSDPKVDNQADGKAGNYLTNALVAQGITEISTIFVDDMVELEATLPWRVEMAIHRLAKDLKLLPMFKGVSSEAVKKLKLQAVKDIIRPLKHPRYLNDFLVNCYLIARYVDTMPPEDIEEMIVAAFLPDLLMPTTQFTFKELDSLNQLKFDQPDNAQITRRLKGIRRILKLIARRVVTENISGAQHFLQQLHQNQILGMAELPADVQYFINSVKLAEDAEKHFDQYAVALNQLKEPADAIVYLQCFRRIAPVLAESGRWEMVEKIAGVLKTACMRYPMDSDKVHALLKVNRRDRVEDFSATALFRSLRPADRAIGFVFKDIAEPVINAYGAADKDQRRMLDHIIEDFSSFGVEILGRMITDSADRDVRKQSFEALAGKGLHARNWAVATLEDLSHPWFVYRNALMILGRVSREERDFACARRFLDHENAKLREEAVNLIVSLRPADGESLIIRAFDDENPKVRWRAIRNLEQLSPVSESAMRMLMLMISAPVPKDKAAADQHIGKITAIISALGAMPVLPDAGMAAAQVLVALKNMVGEKKSFWKKVVSSVGGDHESGLLKAAVPLLARHGGDDAMAFLKQAARSYPDLSDAIKRAMMQRK